MPDVLAAIACQTDSTYPVTSGGRLYVSCNKGSTVIAIDLATDKVAQTYQVNNPFFDAPDGLVVDGGLWVSMAAGVTSTSDRCCDVVRFDLKSGRQTTDLEDYDLIGDVGGSLLMIPLSGDPVKVNPSSLGKTTVHWKRLVSMLEEPWTFSTGCGMIWAIGGDGGGPGGPGPQEIVRIDPSNGSSTTMKFGYGAAMKSKQGNTYMPDSVIQNRSTCWAVTAALGESSRLFRLGKSCMDMETSLLDSEPFVLGDTYWVSDGARGIRQIDPFSAKTGREWELPKGANGWVVDAGGQVWVNNDPGLTRVNIPLDKMTLSSPPPVLPCTAPAASPSVSASASPSASPTPTPTPTPALADSPVPTDAPTPNP
jgi:hypothetical protein